MKVRKDRCQEEKEERSCCRIRWMRKVEGEGKQEGKLTLTRESPTRQEGGEKRSGWIDEN